MNAHLSTSIRWLAVSLATATTALSAQALTPAETTGVLYMKQEEKVARDVYQALAVRWNHATLRNIALSEQRHMEAVDSLIRRHGLTDATPDEPGRFSIPELQKLHDDLLVQGSQSLTEALRVGVLIEEADITDLKEALAVSGDASLQRVFGNLLRASDQHLTAFQSALGTTPTSDTVGSPACPRGGTCTTSATCDRPSGRGGKQGNAGRGGHGRGAGAGQRDGTCAGDCTQESCPAQAPAVSPVTPGTAPGQRRGR